MKHTFRLSVSAVVAVFVTIVILIGSFCWFSSNTNQMMESTTEFYLETNVRSQAAAFHTKLENQVEMLQAVARSWEMIDLTNHDAVLEGLSRMYRVGNFQRLAVAGPNGRMIDMEGKPLGNVSDTFYFHQAMEGKTTISDTIMRDSRTGNFYLYIAVPILQQEKPAGVMYGQFPLTVLSNLIETVGFQETSTSLLFSGDGVIFARSSGGQLVPGDAMNFYDLGSGWGQRNGMSLNDVKLAVLEGKTLTLPYQTLTGDRLAILTPVGINHWYYAIVISKELIRQQSNKLSYNVALVEILITAAFIWLFVTIFQLMRRTAIVEMTNDRFKMANTQINALVFDYDFQTQRLELDGSAAFIDKDAKEIYAIDEILPKLKALLHENDTSIIQDIVALHTNGKDALRREIRIRCADGHYYWHRLTGTVVRSDTGEMLHLVGNLVNVEDDMSKQEKLKHEAEIDPLSGLLNKGAFNARVKKMLAESDGTESYAFYIIDLDNFKKVNDTLGHIVGDRVISEVAQKLGTVFLEDACVGRIGGDEFAAFFKVPASEQAMGWKSIETKAGAACAIVNKIYSDGKNEVHITASIGVSIYPGHGRTFEELYMIADEVLYHSKNGGKNRYTICGDLL